MCIYSFAGKVPRKGTVRFRPKFIKHENCRAAYATTLFPVYSW